MTTNRHSETPPRDGESVSAEGQSTELDTRDDTTSLATLQYRIGHIRLKARLPGACIAVQIVGPITAELLTVDEARHLIGALAALIGDIEGDLAQRRRSFLQLIAAADASAESYAQL